MQHHILNWHLELFSNLLRLASATQEAIRKTGAGSGIISALPEVSQAFRARFRRHGRS